MMVAVYSLLCCVVYYWLTNVLAKVVMPEAVEFYSIVQKASSLITGTTVVLEHLIWIEFVRRNGQRSLTSRIQVGARGLCWVGSVLPYAGLLEFYGVVLIIGAAGIYCRNVFLTTRILYIILLTSLLLTDATYDIITTTTSPACDILMFTYGDEMTSYQPSSFGYDMVVGMCHHIREGWRIISSDMKWWRLLVLCFAMNCLVLNHHDDFCFDETTSATASEGWLDKSGTFSSFVIHIIRITLAVATRCATWFSACSFGRLLGSGHQLLWNVGSCVMTTAIMCAYIVFIFTAATGVIVASGKGWLMWRAHRARRKEIDRKNVFVASAVAALRVCEIPRFPPRALRKLARRSLEKCEVGTALAKTLPQPCSLCYGAMRLWPTHKDDPKWEVCTIHLMLLW